MDNLVVKKINLTTPQDVKDFCFVAGSFARNIRIVASHDNYIVDAKSILGMFSLDLSQPITLTISSEHDLDINKIDKEFFKWIVE